MHDLYPVKSSLAQVWKSSVSHVEGLAPASTGCSQDQERTARSQGKLPGVLSEAVRVGHHLWPDAILNSLYLQHEDCERVLCL